ncbi:MAG: tRNA 2-selenouridine(34) synthase MnmH [Alphaproteobacteria bacterium]|jgi:tRNA 2-selenouridine synthase|nr:tRNA 2-selenouridine(34) synthase MnmH [Alphaproteobacteria bacterium]
MPQHFDTLSQLLSHGFNDVIDVRSPAEFAEDHIPGAINLPALSNEERARVGTIYTQEAPFEARKIGAALVARNVARHLETGLADRDGGWRPLVHCWRGGQRSESVATILRAVGWRAETIAGGYQSYRRLVHAALYEAPVSHRFILLDGYTGTAKTDILHRLDALGIQVLDLEGMAGHRGSILGGQADAQPSQKAFESALACRLAGLDPARPVVLEAESSKIGERIIPPMVWAAMKDAPRIVISAPIEARAAYLVDTYNDVISRRDELVARLTILKRHRGAAVVDTWLDLLNRGDLAGLARALMEDHYDPSYAKSRAAHHAEVLHEVRAEALDPQGRADLAERIARIVRAER